MAVTFDANATADVTATAATSITGSNLTVGSGSNRALVVQLNWFNNGGTVPASVVVRWDELGTPQSCALITGADNTVTVGTNKVKASLHGLVAPTSGAKQTKASWSNVNDVTMNVTSFAGVDQTGGTTSFPNGTSATTTTASGINHTITSATNNMIIACETSAASFSAVGNTQTYLDNTTASGAGQRAAGAATVTASYTTAGGNGAVGVGTDILLFTGGATAWGPLLGLANNRLVQVH